MTLQLILVNSILHLKSLFKFQLIIILSKAIILTMDDNYKPISEIIRIDLPLILLIGLVGIENKYQFYIL